MRYYLEALKRYADFSGRARRAEYWWFFLFYSIFAIILGMIDIFAPWHDYGEPYYLSYAYTAVFFLPHLSVIVRRLHDTGRSGWWWFIQAVPLIGEIWFFVLMVTDSDTSLNKYGPSPKSTRLLSETDDPTVD